MPTAVLLIAHGSRRAAANADLDELATLLRVQNVAPIIETSYLDVAAPDIPTGARACIARGADIVKMFPYFLSAGAHVVDDLQHYQRELSAEFPNVEFVVCPHLGLHPLMVQIVLDRLGEPPSPSPAG